MRIFWTQAALDRYVAAAVLVRHQAELAEKSEEIGQMKVKNREILREFSRLVLATAQAMGVTISDELKAKIGRKAVERYFRQRGGVARQGR